MKAEEAVKIIESWYPLFEKWVFAVKGYHTANGNLSHLKLWVEFVDWVSKVSKGAK